MADIDDSVHLAIRVAADKARNQAIGILGVIVSVLAIAGYFGLKDFISETVADRFKQDISNQLKVRKERINIEADRVTREMLSKAKQVAEEADRLTDNLQEIQTVTSVEELRNIVEKLSGRQSRLRKQLRAVMGIETYLYKFLVSKDSGRYEHDTGISTDDFGAAIVSSWNKGGANCKYDIGDFFMSRSQDTWKLKIDKKPGCTWMNIRIVYVPDSLVKRIHTEDEIRPIKVN